jgi:hypothetical protein
MPIPAILLCYLQSFIQKGEMWRTAPEVGSESYRLPQLKQIAPTCLMPVSR